MCSYEKRVRAALKKALESPLATVTAGPGYGKTRAVEEFVVGGGFEPVWVRLGVLESAPARFWSSFTKAVSGTLPGLAAAMGKNGFPYSNSDICDFIDILRKSIAARESMGSAPFLFIFDDFGHSAGGPAGRLMESVLESGLEECRFLLVCGAKTGFEVTGLKSGGFFPLTAAELRYTEEEAAAYFAERGRPLSRAKLRRVWEYTEGWPLAVRAFAESEPALRRAAGDGSRGTLPYPGGKRLEEGGPTLRFDVINSIFERDYFKNYAEDVREALVKLSLLPGFVLENLKNAGIANMCQAVRAVRENLFIDHDHASRVYTMHNMYRDYLSGWQCALPEADKNAFLEDAAEVFLQRALLPQAIECFERRGDLDKMLAALRAHAGERVGAAREDLEYVEDKLRAFPEAFREKNPIVDYLQAVVYFNSNEIERCQNLLRVFIDRLKGLELAEARELLGKAYYLMGNVSMLCSRSDFPRFYAKAAKYLNGPDVAAGRVVHVGNRGMMGMDGRDVGALERMKAAMDEAMPYYKQVTGGGEGLGRLFRAEAAYHTLRLEEARRHALAAISEADAHGQEDISCNARLLLARAALMKGEPAELLRQAEDVSEYAGGADSPVLERLRDSGAAWLYICMGMTDLAAAALKKLSSESGGRPLATDGRENVIWAFYMLETGAYEELLAHLDRMENYHARWIDKLNIHILRALALTRTRCAGAMESLWLACDMAMGNEVAAPFVERGHAMHALAEAAKAQPDFDRGWLDGISRQALAYSRRLAGLTKAFQARYGAERRLGVRLTGREMEVLANMAQGMTREEIAQMNFISVNTVKSVIRNIYMKLGAVNRADAVRISTRLGLLR
ncbi:MAG: LuxR C-terminal-related transcriptional regulator [Clostridiales Family XIII bacterium]|jgi:LuxR family maltose regulon positive regulatory protein|nr:LuxR C-terminal-related transcriptional regulator [Clostridiales Family XIII bacterium]